MLEWALLAAAGVTAAGVGTWIAFRDEDLIVGAEAVTPTLTPAQVYEASTPLDLTGIRATPRLSVDAAEAVPQAEPDPSVISEANGWTPVWVDSARPGSIKWGGCLWEVREAQSKAGMGEKESAKATADLIGRGVGWVVDYFRAQLGGLAICWLVRAPIAKWEIRGVGKLFTPCKERGGGRSKSIVGWNPASSRPGVNLTVGPWPLGPKPATAIGGAWIRKLGNYAGWGEAFHLVAYQAGRWRSFLAMDVHGWRQAMIMQGQRVEGGKVRGGSSLGTDGVLKYLKKRKCPGQSSRVKVLVGRKKALRYLK